MPLDFTGIDPDTGNNGSATVWIDHERQDLVFQGVTADADTVAEISAKHLPVQPKRPSVGRARRHPGRHRPGS
jgi:hypothetical protein